MMDLQGQLEVVLLGAVRDSLGGVGVGEGGGGGAEVLAGLSGADMLVRPTGEARFGDFQSNLAMSLGKRLGMKPREVADAVAGALRSGDPGDAGAVGIEKVEVAGPGFINLWLTGETLVAAAGVLAGVLGLRGAVGGGRTAGSGGLRGGGSGEGEGAGGGGGGDVVVVDYAGPNLAKEMHIGHLRSTVIGDAIVRVLRFRGDTVIAQNHIGDWGTQFGMLLEHLIDTGVGEAGADFQIGDLNALYQEAKRRDDADAAFAKRCERGWWRCRRGRLRRGGCGGL